MLLHGNAALTPKQRLKLATRIVDEGWSLSEAAAAAEVSERTARKWVRRYREEGDRGLLDRSSAPARGAGATAPERVEAIAALRRLRMSGQEIAECLGMALSTVQGILTRSGLGKLSRLEPPEPPNRSERKRAGELVQVERLMTDKGSAYRSKLHQIACRMLGIKHTRTRPYRPRTNGKAERFIRTLLGGWAYGAI